MFVASGPRAESPPLIDLSNFCPNNISELSQCRMFTLQMASIGKRTGVGNLLGVQVQGFLAWWIWRNYYLAHLLTLHKKIRVLADWITDIFFRRDVTMFKTLAEEK
jgi:NADH dehydrogenase FAD-containing subunit